MQRHVFRGLIALALLAVLAGSGRVVAENAATLTLSANPAAPRVGDAVTLTLDYHLPPGGRLAEPRALQGLEGFTLLESPRVVKPGRIETRLLVDQLEPFAIGPIRLSWLDGEGHSQVLTSQTVTLSPASNLGERPEEAELKPIQGIEPVGRPWLKWLGLAALGLVLLLAAGAGVWYWRGRRRAARLQAEPPHARARRELLALEAQEFLGPEQAKVFYFRYSEILRRYLEDLRGFPAAEYTTPEIASALTEEQDRVLLPLLRHADLVKFADASATPAQKEQALAKALAYVQDTEQAFEAPAPATEADS